MIGQSHRVEWWGRRGEKFTRVLPTPEAAYRLWLALARGTYAKLYQYDKLVGQGNGLESN